MIKSQAFIFVWGKDLGTFNFQGGLRLLETLSPETELRQESEMPRCFVSLGFTPVSAVVPVRAAERLPRALGLLQATPSGRFSRNWNRFYDSFTDSLCLL